METRLKRAWRELWSRVSWVGLALPWVIFVVLFWATLRGHIGPHKPTLEIVALSILYTSVAVAFLRYRTAREPFFLWLAVLCAVFTLREHHFPHTGNGVFIAVALLVLYAWRARARLRPFLDCRAVMTTLAAVMMSYYISWSLDSRQWRAWLPGEKKTVWSPVEECMEVVGHLFLLMAAIVAVVMATRFERSVKTPAPATVSRPG